MNYDAQRLAQITTLKEGSHEDFETGACIMEAVAYVTGEPWSDHPACACPVITTFMISWNDALLSDEERTRLLLPLIPKIVGTRGSEALESRRATMAADWLVRTHAPAWLRLAGLTAEADALAGLPEITDFAQTPSIMEPLRASRVAAERKWAAAGDAARDAVRAAAWAAAGTAAWAAAVAAWAAAGTARDAAWGAAGAAARAAGVAARDVLKSTQDALQASAIELVIRMCEAGEPT
jgi:hypothetical protein